LTWGARLVDGQARPIDLGRVTVDVPLAGDAPTRYFDNTVGIGFDGVVTQEVRRFKRLRGMALYLPAVLRTVFVSHKPARSEIAYRADGASPASEDPVVRIQSTVLMATICNGQREGGGFLIAPDARNDDGLFDVCVAENVPRLRILALIPHFIKGTAENVPRLRILALIPHFIKGTHVDKPNVTMLRSAHVVITSPDPLIAHVDGEMLCTDAHRIECEIVPLKLRVVC